MSLYGEMQIFSRSKFKEWKKRHCEPETAASS